MNFSTKNLRREGLYGVCALMMTLNVEAERLPEMPLKTSLNGVEVSDMGRFIPGLGDYTLEGKAKVGRTIRIAFLELSLNRQKTVTYVWYRKTGRSMFSKMVGSSRCRLLIRCMKKGKMW